MGLRQTHAQARNSGKIQIGFIGNQGRGTKSIGKLKSRPGQGQRGANSTNKARLNIQENQRTNTVKTGETKHG